MQVKGTELNEHARKKLQNVGNLYPNLLPPASKGKVTVADPDWEDTPYKPVPITPLSSKPGSFCFEFVGSISGAMTRFPSSDYTWSGYCCWCDDTSCMAVAAVVMVVVVAATMGVALMNVVMAIGPPALATALAEARATAAAVKAAATRTAKVVAKVEEAAQGAQ